MFVSTTGNVPLTTHNLQPTTTNKPDRMACVKNKIESVMKRTGKAPDSPLAALLYGASIPYGAVQKLRAACYRHRLLPSRRLPCRVISIGNITVGGTGKTPMTIFVADEIRRADYRVVVISRGYRGDAEKRGGVVSDGRTILMKANTAGDEPYLIARRLKDVPVLVGKNRFAAGMLACDIFQPDVIVLDDAFQHLQLQRDLDLVLLDCGHPLGNRHLLPRGVLRESPAALARSSACILTRCRDDAAIPAADGLQSLASGRPFFRSTYIPFCYATDGGEQKAFDAAGVRTVTLDPQKIKDRKVFAFSGIARNDDFRRTAAELGFDISGFLDFADHHPYTVGDLSKIVSRARHCGADELITTEKDYVRIARRQPLALKLIVVGVKISFGEDRQEFDAYVKNSLI